MQSTRCPLVQLCTLCLALASGEASAETSDSQGVYRMTVTRTSAGQELWSLTRQTDQDRVEVAQGTFVQDRLMSLVPAKVHYYDACGCLKVVPEQPFIHLGKNPVVVSIGLSNAVTVNGEQMGPSTLGKKLQQLSQLYKRHFPGVLVKVQLPASRSAFTELVTTLSDHPGGFGFVLAEAK